MKVLIFSVAGPGDADLSQVAALNIIQSNPLIDITFTIINNSGNQIIPKYPSVNNIIIKNGIPNNNQYSPSVHHAMAINSFLATLAQSQYDYYLLIDPDVIQIQTNAITSIIKKMRCEDIDVYSFPWHLKWYSKYRSRTSPHFFFFSRYTLHQNILNFSPLLDDKSFLSLIPIFLYRLKSRVLNSSVNSVKDSSHLPQESDKNSSTTFILKILSSFFITRFAINSAKDTGYKNSYQYLSSKGIKVEIGKMFISMKSLSNIFHLRVKFLEIIERHLLYKRISFAPRSSEYIYTAKYDSLSIKTKTEIFSIDGKNISFVHLRKFTHDFRTYDIEKIKAIFVTGLLSDTLDKSEQNSY